MGEANKKILFFTNDIKFSLRKKEEIKTTAKTATPIIFCGFLSIFFMKLMRLFSLLVITNLN